MVVRYLIGRRPLLKTCAKCGETKPLDQFDVRADTGRHRSHCKACRRSYQVGLNRSKAIPSKRATRFIGASERFRCNRCGLEKEAEAFARRRPGGSRLQSWCRACFSAYKAERHRRFHDREMERIRRNQAQAAAANRIRIRAYLSEHPCVDCGENDPRVLDFDHVRGQKTADVSALVAGGSSWERVMREIDKCDVRCANDHRRVTYDRRQDGQGIRESRGDWGLRPRRELDPRPALSKSAALVH